MPIRRDFENIPLLSESEAQQSESRFSPLKRFQFDWSLYTSQLRSGLCTGCFGGVTGYTSPAQLGWGGPQLSSSPFCTGTRSSPWTRPTPQLSSCGPPHRTGEAPILHETISHEPPLRTFRFVLHVVWLSCKTAPLVLLLVLCEGASVVSRLNTCYT